MADGKGWAEYWWEFEEWGLSVWNIIGRLGLFTLTYHMPAPDILCLILTTILEGRHHYSHFADEEIGHRVVHYQLRVPQEGGAH